MAIKLKQMAERLEKMQCALFEVRSESIYSEETNIDFLRCCVGIELVKTYLPLIGDLLSGEIGENRFLRDVDEAFAQEPKTEFSREFKEDVAELLEEIKFFVNNGEGEE